MRNRVKIASVVFLVAIYCFAMGAVTEARASVDLNTRSAVKEKVISELSQNLYGHHVTSEITVGNVVQLPSENAKNTLPLFVVPFKACKQRFEAQFSQYVSSSNNVLIHYRKSDFIYPFHYFW